MLFCQGARGACAPDIEAVVGPPLALKQLRPIKSGVGAPRKRWHPRRRVAGGCDPSPQRARAPTLLCVT